MRDSVLYQAMFDRADTWQCERCHKVVTGLGTPESMADETGEVLCLGCAVDKQQDYKSQWFAWMDSLEAWDNRTSWQRLKDWWNGKAVPIKP